MNAIKTGFLIITGILISSTLEAQYVVPKGKVKSVVVLEEKYDVLVKKQYKESETYYDSKGNILEEIEYSEGKVTKHFKYAYDQDNNKIKEEEFDPAGKLKESSEYKYENGLRTEKIVYDPNRKAKSRKIYQYTTF